jgi:hypothetical protein
VSCPSSTHWKDELASLIGSIHSMLREGKVA